MPRPISYAVFCLKKKNAIAVAAYAHVLPERGSEQILGLRHRRPFLGRDAPAARLRSARALGRVPLGLANRPALGCGLLGEPSASVLVADLEDRPAVTLAELTLLEQGEHLVGQIEKPDQVGDRGATPADAAGELLLRDPEVVHQRGAGPRLLDRVEVLPDHVLDQRGLQALVLGRGTDYRRHTVDAGLPRGAPAALSGDQLVAAVVQRPNDQRLQK